MPAIPDSPERPLKQPLGDPAGGTDKKRAIPQTAGQATSASRNARNEKPTGRRGPRTGTFANA
eukprot:15333079-Alexandrium_andersonii.AAC.1